MSRPAINARRGHRGFYSVPLEQRFWAKVDRRSSDECWLWLAHIDSKGYGTIDVDGRCRRAHRVAWELHHGKPLPEGSLACHSCDNPPCVNPNHIWPGSYTDNNRDTSAKGRHPNQAKTHCAKGHRYTDQNTILDAKGHRRCRSCREAQSRATAVRRYPGSKHHASL